MRLRTATSEDKSALVALWEQAFGDTSDTVETFFQLCGTFRNTLVAQVDGKVRAALYLLENQLQVQETVYRAAYIYAAATETDYRKNGLMTALLAFADEIAVQRQFDFLFLTPAEDGLFSYYGKRGFQSAFAKQVARVPRADLEHAAGKPLNAVNGEQNEQVSRHIALRGGAHILWSDAVLRFDRFLRETYNVQYRLSPNGFTVYETEEDAVTATEFCFADGGFSALANLLLQNTKAAQFTLCAPCFAALPPQFACETVKTAMIKPISAHAKAQTVQNAYLGITLG